MPTIRITDSTWDRLKRWAVPLEDSADDAVRKALDAAEEHLRCPQSKQLGVRGPARPRLKRPRLAKGLKTPQSAYVRPILEALQELGSSAPVAEVLRLVERKIGSQLNEVDRQGLPSSGTPRWQNTAQWTRLDLVKQGLLKNDSPTGVWELTPEGTRELQRLS
jgi:hypothetical protein